MARPTLLSTERANQIAALIVAGNDQETAALASGVSKSAHYNWLARGRAERDRLDSNPKLKPKASEMPFLEYVEAIEKARAEAEARLVLRIAKAAEEPKTWQAAAWLLERRDPKRWGRVSRTEISGPDGGAIQSEVVSTVSDAELAALADKIAGAGPVIPELPATPGVSDE